MTSEIDELPTSSPTVEVPSWWRKKSYSGNQYCCERIYRHDGQLYCELTRNTMTDEDIKLVPVPNLLNDWERVQ